MELYTLAEMADVYVDAFVAREDTGFNDLLFLSAWGQDTAIQSLLAKLTLPVKEGGLSALILRGETSTKRLYIQAREKLAKLTGRVGKDSLFHGLTHLFIYDGGVKQFDKANQRALLLKLPQEEDEAFKARLWQVVQELCIVPLLPEWQCLLDYFTEQQWIRTFTGVNIDAVQVDLGSDALSTLVTSLIQQQVLQLPKPRSHLTLAYAKPKPVLN